MWCCNTSGQSIMNRVINIPYGEPWPKRDTFITKDLMETMAIYWTRKSYTIFYNGYRYLTIAQCPSVFFPLLSVQPTERTLWISRILERVTTPTQHQFEQLWGTFGILMDLSTGTQNGESYIDMRSIRVDPECEVHFGSLNSTNVEALFPWICFCDHRKGPNG